MSELRIFRDLPGIAEITAKLEAAGWPEEGPIREEIDALSIQLFGLTEAETEYPFLVHEVRDAKSERLLFTTGLVRELDEDDGDIAIRTLDNPIDYEDWDQKLELAYCDFGEAPDFVWRALGWDVTDGAGNEHPALDHFSLQMLCASHKLCGHLPDSEEAEEAQTRKWARRLRLDAEAKMEAKRDQGPKFTGLSVADGGRAIRPPKRLKPRKPTEKGPR